MDLDAKLQAFFDKLDQRLLSVEEKLDNRLSGVEQRCDKLEKTTSRQVTIQKKVSDHVVRLKTTVNVLEQQRLEKNIVIQGVPESEIEDTETVVDTIFDFLDTNFESRYLLCARRVGNQQSNRHRPIIAELSNTNCKLSLMKGLSKKDINCSHFKKSDGALWGTSADKIYLKDHLTPYMTDVFFRARQLRKNKKIKYAWTKLGMVFVKQEENSRAYHIKSAEGLYAYEMKLDNVPHDDEVVEVMECDSDIETSSKASTDSKRQRSPGRIASRRSPSKRVKQQMAQQK